MIPVVDNVVFKTNDFQEALEKAGSEFGFQRYEIPVTDIKVTDGGDFMIQDSRFDITKSGVSNVCSSLRIPNPFAKRIPNHVLIYDINELIKEQDPIIDVFFNKNEQIVDMNFKSGYQTIPNFDLLQSFANDFGDKTRFMFEDAFLKVETGNGIEFEAADQKHVVGTAIKHYPTAHSVTSGAVLIWTLVCTNGMMVPKAFADPIRLRNKTTHSIPSILEEFQLNLSEMYVSVSEIQDALNNLSETPMSFGQVKTLVNKFKRTYGEENIVKLVGDQIWGEYQILKEAKAEENDMLTSSFYELYYNITDFASNSSPSALDSKTIQTFAGNLLVKQGA